MWELLFLWSLFLWCWWKERDMLGCRQSSLNVLEGCRTEDMQALQGAMPEEGDTMEVLLHKVRYGIAYLDRIAVARRWFMVAGISALLSTWVTHLCTCYGVMPISWLIQFAILNYQASFYNFHLERPVRRNIERLVDRLSGMPEF